MKIANGRRNLSEETPGEMYKESNNRGCLFKRRDSKAERQPGTENLSMIQLETN